MGDSLTQMTCSLCGAKGHFAITRNADGQFGCPSCVGDISTHLFPKSSTGLLACVAPLVRSIESSMEHLLSHRRDRYCITCGGPVSAQSRTGNCRVCALRVSNRSSEFQSRRHAGIRRRFADPEQREIAARIVHANHTAARQDPEVDRRLRENMRKNRWNTGDPALREKFLAGTPARIQKRINTLFAWCPDDLREEYRRLRKKGRLSASEAKRIILAHQAHRASLAEMTPFERALERIRQGAGIIEVRPIRRADPTYTLGGVSSIDGATG